MKVCAKCKNNKSNSGFNNSELLNPSGWCKDCKRQYNKKYRATNRDKINTQKREHYKNNKQEIRSDQKIYYDENRSDILEQKKIYYQNNKEDIQIRKNIWTAKRRKENPVFRLRRDVSRSIHRMLKESSFLKEDSSIMKFLPTDYFDKLRSHLENLFEPWMNWNNQGKFNPKIWKDDDESTWTWQIDHIVPQSKLPFSSMEDENFNKCWSIENLRPLSAKQNILDGNRR